jgi:NAD(P)-dependent dehydrogenase (short-subunit alcohol dehydrogenase family)
LVHHGASRGFGRIWTEAALQRGDRVAAAARDVSHIADLRERFGDDVLPLTLDVTDGDQVRHAVAQAHDRFGRLDVVLNNAGYTLLGTAEVASETQVQALFDVNYFGTLRVINAVLPLLRAQGSGHVIGISSGLGIVARPLVGFYSATKWAVEALHDSLSQEVSAFGIKVTLVEPGAYATDFAKDASLKAAPGLPAYSELRQRVRAFLSNQRRGDPEATAGAMLQLVDSDAPPLRLALGRNVIPLARSTYAERLTTWEAWEDVSNAAEGEPRQTGIASF